MRPPELLTLQSLVDGLPRFGTRRAVGLREDLGLRWWSYERLHRHAQHAAALLRDAGVGKGDRVLIRGRNSPEWVGFFFGCVLRGAVVVPIDHDASPELVRRVYAIAEPKVFVTSGESEEPAELGPFLQFKALYADPHPRRDAAQPAAETAALPSDPAVVFFTSGTTSQPRGVVLTHANVVAQILRFRRWRRIAAMTGARMLVMAPFSHAQGFILGIVIPLSLGLGAIYTTSSHPTHLIRLLRDNRVPIFSTVPRVLHIVGKYFEAQRYGRSRKTLGEKLQSTRAWALRRHFVFTHMRRIVGYSALWIVAVGGAPLPEADEDFWRVSGCLLAQGYGLTETAAIVSVNAPMIGPFGSVGKPFDDQEIRIADDGEILVRGANVMASYFGEPAVADGFLRTGDLGRIDRRNRLYVVARKKDVIVTGEGFNVHGSDVEAVLNALPGVEDSVVIGAERGGHTEVHAVLLLREGTDPAAVVGQANLRLPSHQRIASWTLWPERDFPRSALLKPRRQQIAQRVLEEGVPSECGAPPAPSLAEVLAIEERPARLAALAHYIAGRGDDGANIALVRDLGLSSLDLIELLAMIETQSGQPLDRAALDESITLAELQSLAANADSERTLGRLYAVDAPRWPALSVVNAVRRVLNPPLLDTLVRLRTRLTVTGRENLDGLELPAIFAGSGHEHGFDVLLVYSALPAHLRRRLAIVTSRWVFTPLFEPKPETSLAQRLVVGAGFHFILPLFFPFVLSSPYTRSRDTLMEACRLIDRRYSLIAFHGKGLGVVAQQCGVPIVPVRVGNPERADFRLRFRRAPASIHFEQPIVPDPTADPTELSELLGLFFARAGQ